MSKYVKSLISDDLRGRLEGVDDALLVDVIGIDANATVRLRADLRSKGIKLMVIKNSLAKRAT
ncbi:MAG: 50S ribosomal protein L10, partial [Pirellulales bacterium]|nr:50S ribosomal protein L10 [Pirellulales bacterium]